MLKRIAEGVRRPKKPSDNHGSGNGVAGWRRIISGSSIVEQVIAGVLVVVIVGAATVAWKNISGGNTKDSVVTTMPQASPSSTESASSQPPLRAEAFPFEVLHFTPPAPTVVLPLTPDKVPSSPATAGEGARDFLAWARSLGGADAQQTGVSFVLRSDQTAPVIVTNVRIVVQQRNPAMRGTWLRPGGAGGLINRVMEVNLDRDPPTVKRIAYEDNATWSFPLKVSQPDPELFTIIATAKNSFCLWKVEVDYLIDGEQHTLTVDDDGQPFRTTGVKNAIDNRPGSPDATGP
jgi:hypothetical protein